MAIPTHIGQRDPGDGSYNPGLQTGIEPVTRDNAIYDAFVATITAADTLGSGTEKYRQDIYSRSPLSGLLGFWNTSSTITVTVSSPDVPSAPAISHTYTALPVNQVATLSVLGFVARAGVETVNDITVSDGAGGLFGLTVAVAALPATDTEGRTSSGFPEIKVNKAAEASAVGDDLYFSVVAPGRACIAFDCLGNVRWYVVVGDAATSPALCLPTYNNVRLSDGTFIGSDDHLQQYYTPADMGPDEPQGQRELWRFDMSGRVHGIYFIRDRAHHSLFELPGENALLYASDYISNRARGEGPDPDGANRGSSSEDCIAVLDLTTGYEKVYYDLRIILNFWRTPVPLRFISANHDDWEATESGEVTTDWSDLLLTPVNPDTGLPYDLSVPAQKTEADRRFWTWGQHNVQVLQSASSTASVIEFSVFNNGNYRTRSRAAGVVVSENASRCARYRVDLGAQQVSMLSEYGETEVGAAGYSPYVSTADFFNFQDDSASPRLLANFGGSNFQENADYPTGLPLTIEPGYSDRVDPAENLTGTFQGRVIVQEIDLNTTTPLFEIEMFSGKYKVPAGDETDIRRVDLYSFRAYKMPLYG